MLRYFLQKTWHISLDILFPPICLNCENYLPMGMSADAKHDCRSSGGKMYKNYLCDSCLQTVKFNQTLFCPVCRARLPENKKICHFDSTYLLAAAGNYSDAALANLIHYFKYRRIEAISLVLGEFLIMYLEKIISHSSLAISRFSIIPIPLHPARQRYRGFNQAELLAKEIARHFNLDLIKAIQKIKNNKPQVGMDMEKRAQNVLKSFQIKNPEAVRGKNIILIDDVFTSGATMNEAARILKLNGVKKIIALVAAKA